MESMPARLHDINKYLESTRQQLEEAKAAVGITPPGGRPLRKSARLAEPNALLTMDKPKNEIVDGNRSEEDSTPTPKQTLAH